VVSAIGIVPVPLYLLRRNGNEFSVFSTFCVDVAVNILDLSRVAVRLIATANGRIIGHVPCCIKLFVQELILWRVVAHSVALPIFLCLDRHRQ
jgi:hypothetical protein